MDTVVNASLLACLHDAVDCGLVNSELVKIPGKFPQTYQSASGCSGSSTYAPSHEHYFMFFSYYSIHCTHTSVTSELALKKVNCSKPGLSTKSFCVM